MKREDSKKKHESLLEENPRLTISYVIAFMMQPQVRPALCLLLTATVLIVTAAISAYVQAGFPEILINQFWGKNVITGHFEVNFFAKNALYFTRSRNCFTKKENYSLMDLRGGTICCRWSRLEVN